MLLKYEDWLKTQIKYSDCKCGVFGCNNDGLYEGGDSRCWFPVCEEHSALRNTYLHYLCNRRIYVDKNISMNDAYQSELTRRNNLEKRIQEVLNGN